MFAKFATMLLLVWGLTGCITEDPNAFWDANPEHLEQCGVSSLKFNTPTACKIFNASNALKYAREYNMRITVVLPSESAMQSHLANLGVTADAFIQSGAAQAFVRKHVFIGSLLYDANLKSLDGSVVTFSGKGSTFTLAGIQLVALLDYNIVDYVLADGVLP